MKNQKHNKIKKILKKFKSKNNVPLFAYIGIWKGAKGDKEIKYIEREDNREYVDSFILEGEKPKYSFDKFLKDKIKELEGTLILKYFSKHDFGEGGYKFDIPYEKRVIKKQVLKEIKELIDNKENIDFNEDWGVGNIHHKEGKYLIELNVYCNLSFPLVTRDLDKVVKWLIKFSSGKGDFGEPFDYGRAMSTAIMKDATTKEEREEIMKDYKKQIKKAFQKIK